MSSLVLIIVYPLITARLYYIRQKRITAQMSSSYFISRTSSSSMSILIAKQERVALVDAYLGSNQRYSSPAMPSAIRFSQLTSLSRFLNTTIRNSISSFQASLFTTGRRAMLFKFSSRSLRQSTSTSKLGRKNLIIPKTCFYVSVVSVEKLSTQARIAFINSLLSQITYGIGLTINSSRQTQASIQKPRFQLIGPAQLVRRQSSTSYSARQLKQFSTYRITQSKRRN